MCKRIVPIMLLTAALCLACIPAGATTARHPSAAAAVNRFAARWQAAHRRSSRPQSVPEGGTGATLHILPIYPGDTFEPSLLPLPSPYQLVPLR